MMNRPLLLDAFCGAGGASMGYHQAGFEVVGVDIAPQPRYPFEFYQGDALDFIRQYGKAFYAIHGSPPCQRWSDLAKRNGNGADHPDLLTPMRKILLTLDVPWVLENVEGAPLIDPVWLCGTMFPELAVLRHRGFESNFSITTPEHPRHPLVYTKDKRKKHYGLLDQYANFVSVNGGGNCSVRRAREAMGIDWMLKKELNEAIPPAYAEYVSRFLMKAVTTTHR